MNATTTTTRQPTIRVGDTLTWHEGDRIYKATVAEVDGDELVLVLVRHRWRRLKVWTLERDRRVNRHDFRFDVVHGASR